MADPVSPDELVVMRGEAARQALIDWMRGVNATLVGLTRLMLAQEAQIAALERDRGEDEHPRAADDDRR